MLRLLKIKRIGVLLRLAAHEKLPGGDEDQLGLKGLFGD
jgi:hypothetical protein